MAEPALRALAVAGVLATGLLFGGVSAAPALAQPDDSGSTSQDPGGTDDTGGTDPAPDAPADSERAEDGGSAPEEPKPVESGSDDAEQRDDSGGEVPVKSPPARRVPKKDYGNSIKLPFFRFPAAAEMPPAGWPRTSTFYTTVEIPMPTLGDFFTALRIVPPTPPPGPAFRTQEEAPVVDAGTGTTTHASGGGGGGADVFRAPLVTVPRSVTIAGLAPKPTAVPPAGAPIPPGVTQPGVAGVRTPVIRGSIEPTPGANAQPQAAPLGGPLGAPTTRPAGYPRGLTNPTLAEIAAVALPGVAGLMFLTFSGGMIGYRQANSVRYVRTAGAERFLA